MYFSSTFAVSTILALASAIPTNFTENSDSLQTRANEACGLHWRLEVGTGPAKGGQSITVDWVLPTSATDGHHVQTLSGDPSQRVSLCNDKFSKCLTVDPNGQDNAGSKDGTVFRFGFGSDMWLSTDKPRCSNGKVDVKKDGITGKVSKLFSSALGGQRAYTQDGDCSFACKAAMN
jgi:hypothetical protein